MASVGIDGKSMGWRLVVGLAALAVVAVGVSLALMALSPMVASTEGSRLSLHQPWAACARAVRHQLAGIEGVDVGGPARAKWEVSGAGVDLSGRATGSDMRPRGFSCHAIRLGTSWQVERLIFTER